MRNNNVVQQNKFAFIEQWLNSGLSQKQFCEQNNIAYSVFQYWQKKYKQQQSAAGKPASFIELNIPAAHAGIEMICPDGKRLLFHQSVTADFLKALMG